MNSLGYCNCPARGGIKIAKRLVPFLFITVLITAFPFFTLAERELNQSFALEIIRDIDGIVEESLAVRTEISFELPLNGLNIELTSSFDELISHVHDIKISDVSKAVEGIKALRDDVSSIESSKIDEALRKELINGLDIVQRALGEDRLDEAVSQLRDFRELVSKALDDGRLKKKGDARKLRSKAKTAIRNINNIEGLKEDIIDLTCTPPELDCIPIDIAESLKSKLDVAKEALEYYQNTAAVSQLRDFIDLVERGHDEGAIVSKEADSLISKAEAIIGKINKGKSGRDFTLDVSATISEVEVAWKLETKAARFPAPGKDNQSITVSFEIDADFDAIDLIVSLKHEGLEFLERWSEEKNTMTNGLAIAAEINLDDLKLSEIAVGERKDHPNDKKKNRLTTALETGTEVDLGNLKLSGSIRNEHKEFPNDPKKDERSFNSEAEVQRTFESLELNGTVGSEKVIFPNDHKKDRSINEFEIEAAWELDDLELTAILEDERTRFPHDERKDKMVKERQIQAGLNLGKFDLTGALEKKITDYPNDITKNKLVNSCEIQAEFDLDESQFTMTFERKETEYPNATIKNKVVSKIEFEMAVAFSEGLDLTLTTEFEDESFPNDPGRDKVTAALEAAFEVSF